MLQRSGTVWDAAAKRAAARLPLIETKGLVSLVLIPPSMRSVPRCWCRCPTCVERRSLSTFVTFNPKGSA